jgi:alkaline phosphatase
MLSAFQSQSSVDLYDRLSTGDAFSESECAIFRDIVNENTEFDITLPEAQEILTTEENEYKVEGHSYLSYNYFPKIHDFKEFYVYETEIFKDLIGRIVGKQQYAVWATGTHTNTPVPIIAYGPETVTKGFGKMMHTTEWAQLAIDIMKNGGTSDDSKKFDLNEDGAVTLGDLVFFIKYFTGLN